MFNLFKKKSVEILAPFAGKVIPIEEVKDDIFAQKMMGDGVAIVPSEGEIHAPIKGVVSAVANTNHAIGITSPEGIELIVHYGIDTVKHKGQGFEVFVKQGQKVEAGDLLIKADMNYFNECGVDLTSPVLVTNSSEFNIEEKAIGKSVGQGQVLYIVNKK